MKSFNLFIFDLDNTLYDWYSAFLPAFYRMVGVASDILRCDENQLLDELQQIHIKYHDVEHPFALFETPLVQSQIKSRGADEVWKSLDPALHAFNKARKENLRLYPNAKETLQELRNRGSQLVAYTDSKYFAAVGRVERLGLSALFDRIYCREKSQSLSRAIERKLDFDWVSKIVEIPSHRSKPNPQVLRDVITGSNASVENTAYVGDSISKDVLMAARVGCYSIWAKYGAHTDREMYERLIRVSHWTPEDIEREKNYSQQAKDIVPDFICEHSIREVLDAAPPPVNAPM